MAHREHEPQRLYWKIGEVANLINSTPSAIRHWLIYFEEHTAKRSRNHTRQFNKYEVLNILVINYLIKEELYTLPGAKIKFHKWLKGDYKIPKRFLEIPGITEQPKQ